ncbi:MAG: ParB/RepB/Spo0J family partition protein [Gemmatimonadales bacterium]
MTTGGKSKRLGRGLEALLGPTSTAEARRAGMLQQVPVDSIRPNPYQPRQSFNQVAITELAGSLKASGLLQPIVLRDKENGTYELIAGERRWRAARELGWNEIGAVVREVDDRTLLTLALVENLQRDALSPIDEAQGYKRLVDEFSVSQQNIADLVGRDRSTVANALRLLKLPRMVQELLHQGELNSGHARALLQLGSSQEMEQLARIVVEQGLSVRDTESRARGDHVPKRRPRKDKNARQTSPEVRRIEDTLRDFLKTDVFVSSRGKNGGRISLSFYSNDDLARLLELILGRQFHG